MKNPQSVRNGKRSDRLIKGALFWGNLTFLFLFRKYIISSHRGTMEFLIQNLATIIAALVVTELLTYSFAGKALKVATIASWLMSVIMALILLK